ncbi:hypothetical protein H6G17_26175 [Chroococcidiopsis sp. FACHB-1243]|uniref:hypothetical protein n=1 Tax=Chroococcidiopsis sp. [FACHB-1243] TaxID=2692781 RepID=UPI001782D6EF|nr:hypothetical protein [Chroococcidiopsis sp. [FACHB-1243]]MBD2308959.1 hypothetical protein [Chroococcidiopsis sp. [FACHB-1243]]
MSEIQIRAHQLQQFPEKGDVFVDPTTPPTKPVKRYRIKGTGFVVNQIPPGANMEDLEEF